MNEYLLYGEKIVKNDATLKDFAASVLNQALDVMYLNRSEEFHTKGDYVKWLVNMNSDIVQDQERDNLEDMAVQILEDDVSRTDIQYPELLEKYKGEIGPLLYDMDNNGYDMPQIKFFGEGAETFFNQLIIAYMGIHLYDILKTGID